MITEIVYLGRNNTVDLLLKADGAAVDLSPVTRMVVVLPDDTEIDSDDEPTAFDWDTGTTGKVILSFGDLELDTGRQVATLVVYDPTNADGIIWGKFALKVVALAPPLPPAP